MQDGWRSRAGAGTSRGAASSPTSSSSHPLRVMTQTQSNAMSSSSTVSTKPSEEQVVGSTGAPLRGPRRHDTNVSSATGAKVTKPTPLSALTPAATAAAATAAAPIPTTTTAQVWEVKTAALTRELCALQSRAVAVAQEREVALDVLETELSRHERAMAALRMTAAEAQEQHGQRCAALRERAAACAARRRSALQEVEQLKQRVTAMHTRREALHESIVLETEETERCRAGRERAQQSRAVAACALRDVCAEETRAQDVSYGLRGEVKEMVLAIAERQRQRRAAVVQMMEEELTRRELHSRCEDLKGTIRVYCRVKGGRAWPSAGGSASGAGSRTACAGGAHHTQLRSTHDNSNHTVEATTTTPLTRTTRSRSKRSDCIYSTITRCDEEANHDLHNNNNKNNNNSSSTGSSSNSSHAMMVHSPTWPTVTPSDVPVPDGDGAAVKPVRLCRRREDHDGLANPCARSASTASSSSSSTPSSSVSSVSASAEEQTASSAVDAGARKRPRKRHRNSARVVESIAEEDAVYATDSGDDAMRRKGRCAAAANKEEGDDVNHMSQPHDSTCGTSTRNDGRRDTSQPSQQPQQEQQNLLTLSPSPSPPPAQDIHEHTVTPVDRVGSEGGVIYSFPELTCSGTGLTGTDADRSNPARQAHSTSSSVTSSARASALAAAVMDSRPASRRNSVRGSEDGTTDVAGEERRAADTPSVSTAHPPLRRICVHQTRANATSTGLCSSTEDFTYDRVFTGSSTQQAVYDEVEGLVENAVDGYHVCIFAYGQTGSGKTYTMEGHMRHADTHGITPRAVRTIFRRQEELAAEGWDYSFSCSFVEIYNEAIRDLLQSPSMYAEFGGRLGMMAGGVGANNSTSTATATGTGTGVGGHGSYHTIQHHEDGSTSITNVRERPIRTLEEFHAIHKQAVHNRRTAKTQMNERSSRSHCVFVLNIRGHNETIRQRVHGVLCLVDLAGSERVHESGAQGQQLREAIHINKSLLDLGKCISALRSGAVVAWRNSKLTYLLQNYMRARGGKILMLVTVSDRSAHLSESLNSLRFAKRVAETMVGPATKRITTY